MRSRKLRDVEQVALLQEIQSRSQRRQLSDKRTHHLATSDVSVCLAWDPDPQMILASPLNFEAPSAKGVPEHPRFPPSPLTCLARHMRAHLDQMTASN